MTSHESLSHQELLFSLCNLSITERCPSELDLDYFVNSLRVIYPSINLNRELMMCRLIHNSQEFIPLISDLVVWCRSTNPDVSFHESSIICSNIQVMNTSPRLNPDIAEITRHNLDIIVTLNRSIDMYYLEGLFWLMYSDPFKLLCSQGYVGDMNSPCKFFQDIMLVSSGSSDTLREILTLDPEYSMRSLIQLAIRKRELSKYCDLPCIPLRSEGQGSYTLCGDGDDVLIDTQAVLLRTTYDHRQVEGSQIYSRYDRRDE